MTDYKDMPTDELLEIVLDLCDGLEELKSAPYYSMPVHPDSPIGVLLSRCKNPDDMKKELGLWIEEDDPNYLGHMPGRNGVHSDQPTSWYQRLRDSM